MRPHIYFTSWFRTVVAFTALLSASSSPAVVSYMLPKFKLEASDAVCKNCDKNGPEMLHKIVIIKEDDRVPREKLPFTPAGAVGHLVMVMGKESHFRGTAFYISDCHVLAAGHSVHDSTGFNSDLSAKPVILMGPPSGKRPHTDGVFLETLEVWQKEQFGSKLLEDDFALFYDPQCNGKKYGHFEVDLSCDQEKLKNLPMRMLSFPEDKMRSDDGKYKDPNLLGYAWEDPNCQTYGTFRDAGHEFGFQHTCASRPGASGGPIYYIDPTTGKHVAIAFHVEANNSYQDLENPNFIHPEDETWHVNDAAPICRIWPKIQKHFEKQPDYIN